MNAPVRIPRGRRTGVSVIVALLLLLSAAAAGSLAVLKALRRHSSGVDLSGTTRWLQRTSWNQQTLLVCGIVIAGVGLLILTVVLLPSRRRLVELVNPDPQTAAGLPRRSLRRTVAATAVHIDGISAAAAGVGRRRIAVKLTSGLRHTDGLKDAAVAAVTDRLDALQLRRPRTVAAHLTKEES